MAGHAFRVHAFQFELPKNLGHRRSFQYLHRGLAARRDLDTPLTPAIT